MTDTESYDEQEDWVAGGTLDAGADGLQFFSGECIQIDRSQLPDPPPDLVA